MKRALILIFVFFSMTELYSYETGFTTSFGNYGISEYTSSSTTYIPYFLWAANLFYYDHADENDTLSYGFELDRDPVKGYSLASELKFIQPFYSISFGPVFGVINESWSLIKPGFSGKLKGEWPGKAFVEIGGDVIPSQYTGAENDYSSYSGFYSFGFYLKQDHILCYFSQFLDNYSSLSGSNPYTDTSLSYIFYTDYYEKGTFFKLQTKLGYEILNRTFTDTSDIEIKSILFGLQADFFINPTATVFLGFDNKIYPSSYGAIELLDVPLYLVTVTSGFKWSQ